MAHHGFEVTKHFHLPTAWQATFTHGVGGRTVGINSEVFSTKDFVALHSWRLRQMDTLPGIGHACGHNLIGISGKFALGNFRTRLSLLAQYPRRRSGMRNQGRSREARHFWENHPSWNSWYELHSLSHMPPIYSRVNQQRRRVVEEK